MSQKKKSSTAYPDNNPKTVMGTAKPSLSKVPASAVIYTSLAMMDGAKKYRPFNWRENNVTASIYIDAAKRHLDAWIDGEQNSDDTVEVWQDPVTGEKREVAVPHLGHAMASLAILIDALENGNLIDDRPLPGPAAKLIARYTKPRTVATGFMSPPKPKPVKRSSAKPVKRK